MRNRASLRVSGSQNRTSKVRSLLFAAALAAVVVACTSPKPAVVAPVARDAKIEVDRYFPLTEQSQWTYRIQDFAKKWTYQNRVRVHGRRFMKELNRDGIEVEESYSSASGPYYVEEQEPMLYYRENGYLHRIFLARQAGKLVPASGSGDTRFLPETIMHGTTWDSDTVAFRVGEEEGALGFRIAHHHEISLDPSEVDVPAGSFRNCVRVDTLSTQAESGKNGEALRFYYSDWYAPGVGLVRTQQWDDEGRERERTRIELMRYEVGANRSGERAAEVRTN
jgi:hypothetical protein